MGLRLSLGKVPGQRIDCRRRYTVGFQDAQEGDRLWRALRHRRAVYLRSGGDMGQDPICHWRPIQWHQNVSEHGCSPKG
jgi:hypothetical protein